MTVANTPLLLHKVAQEGIIEFNKQCYSLLGKQWNLREQLRAADLAYMREGDLSTEHQRAKSANRYGDKTKIQNLEIPIVKPAVENAVTYQTSVFLTGYPIFSVVSSPEFESEALQFNTVLEDQSIRGGWVMELMKFFRDGFKYNLSAIEVDWNREVTAALETDLSFSATQAKPSEVIWEGNALRRWDLYNTFFDTRVEPWQIPTKGEFAGRTQIYSRIALKQLLASLPNKIVANVIPALESGLGTGGDCYYVPELNSNALFSKQAMASTDWLAWAGAASKQGQIDYKNMYEVTFLYARILPSDFGLRVPAANTPQIWKFIIVNQQVIVYAERQTNAHGLIPVLFGQPYDDGLSYQTKSLLDDVTPIQDLSSALANSWLSSRRRAISDRAIYDPSKLSPDHVNSPNPSAKIPVRPSAYGKPVQDAYYPIPFRDDQAQIALAEMQQLQQFAYELTGQNKARSGQFVKGNKTLHEYSDVMAHASGNDQKVSLLLESQIFTPMKEILKINILQYQGGTSLFTRARKEIVKIDPIALRKAVLNFKVSDGLTPTDKQINSDAWTTGMQVIGSSPQINSGYNLAPMFSYLMKIKGADLTPFEKSPQQVAYEQAMQQWSNLAQLAIEKGQEFKQPQPKPQDYGYDPRVQGSAAAAPAAPTEVATRVNNITNNISNPENG